MKALSGEFWGTQAVFKVETDVEPPVSLCIHSRSVSNQKALLDSGTMGTKGHTEVIVPNLTESYNSHVSLCVCVCVN